MSSDFYFFCQPDMYEHGLQLATPEALKNAYRIGRWVWETRSHVIGELSFFSLRLTSGKPERC